MVIAAYRFVLSSYVGIAIVIKLNSDVLQKGATATMPDSSGGV